MREWARTVEPFLKHEMVINGTWLVSEFTGNCFVHTALLYPFLELYQRGMGAMVLLGSEDTYCTNGAAGVCGCIGLSDETQIFHE
jgi:hypothetical protein